MEWIKCSDQFPEEEEMVLLCDYLEGFVTAGYYQSYFAGEGWRVNGGFLNINEFTHWMPLPNPPKR